MKHLGDLGDNLKKKIEAQNKRLEQTAEQQHQQLKDQLERESQAILYKFREESKNWLKQERAIITSDMTENQQIFKKYLSQKWLWLSLAAGSLCLGIFGGSWGLTFFLSQRIIIKQTQLDRLQQEIDQQQQTLNQLNDQTQGIQIYQTSNGTFIIPPPYQQMTPGWECQGRPCYKVE